MILLLILIVGYFSIRYYWIGRVRQTVLDRYRTWVLDLRRSVDEEILDRAYLAHKGEPMISFFVKNLKKRQSKIRLMFELNWNSSLYVDEAKDIWRWTSNKYLSKNVY